MLPGSGMLSYNRVVRGSGPAGSCLDCDPHECQHQCVLSHEWTGQAWAEARGSNLEREQREEWGPGRCWDPPVIPAEEQLV